MEQAMNTAKRELQYWLDQDRVWFSQSEQSIRFARSVELPVEYRFMLRDIGFVRITDYHYVYER